LAGPPNVVMGRPGRLAATDPRRYRDRSPAGGAVSSAGEHFLDMEGAIGSIPIPPTIQIGRKATDLNAKARLASA
jgi:hypothetical protein